MALTGAYGAWHRRSLVPLLSACPALAPQAQDTPLNRVRRQPLRPPNATGTSGVGVNENTFTGNKSGIMWGPWIQYYQEVWGGSYRAFLSN